MNYRAIAAGAVGALALFFVAGSLGAGSPAPVTSFTVTVTAEPGNGMDTADFTPLTLTMAQLSQMTATPVTIDNGATTESGPSITSLLTAAHFTPISSCTNDSIRYWIEASSLNGSAATVTNGEISSSFGNNTTILSIKQNGTAIAGPRLIVSKDANDARDISDVFNITIGRAPVQYVSTSGTAPNSVTSASCTPAGFSQTAPTPAGGTTGAAGGGDVVVNGNVGNPVDWSFSQLGSSMFSQVGGTFMVNKKQRWEGGPALYSVLSANEPQFPAGADGPVRTYVEATSSEDGEVALASWDEIDPSLSGSAITPTCTACKILSLMEGSTATPTVPPTHSVLFSMGGSDTGPRLIMPADINGARDDFGVQFLTVLSAPDVALPATGSGPNLSGANFNKSSLAGAFLVGASMPGANLNGGSLAGAFVDNANLSGATLNNANLTGALLNGADLVGANLHGANLTGANLTGVNDAGANFNGATWANTTCPDGTNSDADGNTCAGNL